jgi:hypothetical protein
VPTTPVTPDNLSAAATRLYASVAHLEVAIPELGYSPEAEGWPLATICAALCAPIDTLYDTLAVPAVPGGPVFDANECPDDYLPYLANYAGVDPEGITSPAELRARILERPQRKRGSDESLKAAIVEEYERLYAASGETPPAVYNIIVYERHGGDHAAIHVATWRDETPDAVATAWGAPINLATSPSEELTAGFSSGSDFAVSRVVDGTDGIPAYTGPDGTADHGWMLKHAYDGSGVDTNLGFRGVTFAGAGTFVVSRYVWVPSSWTGGVISLVADGTFAGATETVLAATNLSLRDQWQRISTRLTVVGGDLAGFVTMRAASMPSSGPTGIVYSDAWQREAGSVATDYIDGSMRFGRWTGAEHASTSESGTTFSSAALERAARRHTRAGIITITTNVIFGGTWLALLSTHASWSEVDMDFADWLAVRDNPSAT